MSAQDNLSHQLFHGPIETLKPGDVIKDTEGSPTWATPNMDYALAHTLDRTRSGFGVAPGGEYPVHHGNIYEVEPVDGESHEDMSSLAKALSPTEPSSNLASKSGFRVKRQVASVLGPQEDRKTIKKNFTKFDPSKESYVKNGRSGHWNHPDA